MATTRDKLASPKPVQGGFLEKLEAASFTRQRVFVAMSGGLCLEFRAPKDDAESDAITKEGQKWASKRFDKTAPALFINLGPKSPVRFGMCYVASVLMVAGYEGYEVGDDGEIVPKGEPQPPLKFEEWLAYAKKNWSQFDSILAAIDRESVRATHMRHDQMADEEGKE